MTQKSRVPDEFAAWRRAGAFTRWFTWAVPPLAAVGTPGRVARGGGLRRLRRAAAVLVAGLVLPMTIHAQSGQAMRGDQPRITAADLYYHEPPAGGIAATALDRLARDLSRQPEVMQQVRDMDRGARLTFFTEARADGRRRLPTATLEAAQPSILLLLQRATTLECYGVVMARFLDETQRVRWNLAVIDHEPELAGPWREHEFDSVMAHVRAWPKNEVDPAEKEQAWTRLIDGMPPAERDEVKRVMAMTETGPDEAATMCNLARTLQAALLKAPVEDRRLLILPPRR
ncbi:hypothetical protein ACILG0_05080 [Pseudomonadota bacterium AL_CKDN230030165-1A_HGKHYDSX7]